MPLNNPATVLDGYDLGVAAGKAEAAAKVIGHGTYEYGVLCLVWEEGQEQPVTEQSVASAPAGIGWPQGVAWRCVAVICRNPEAHENMEFRVVYTDQSASGWSDVPSDPTTVVPVQVDIADQATKTISAIQLRPKAEWEGGWNVGFMVCGVGVNVSLT